MEDKANGVILSFLKWLAKKTVNITGKGLKFTAKKGYENTKNYEISSVKKFAKKFPSAGLYVESNLGKEKYDYLKKQLSKSHQYFVTSKGKGADGNDIYTITTSKANKDLVDFFRENYTNNQSQKEDSHNIGKGGIRRSSDEWNQMSDIGMQKQERDRTERHEAQKHKDIKKEEVTH